MLENDDEGRLLYRDELHQGTKPLCRERMPAAWPMGWMLDWQAGACGMPDESAAQAAPLGASACVCELLLKMPWGAVLVASPRRTRRPHASTIPHCTKAGAVAWCRVSARAFFGSALLCGGFM